jgi:hypothetical protein
MTERANSAIKASCFPFQRTPRFVGAAMLSPLIAITLINCRNLLRIQAALKPYSPGSGNLLCDEWLKKSMTI